MCICSRSRFFSSTLTYLGSFIVVLSGKKVEPCNAMTRHCTPNHLTWGMFYCLDSISFVVTLPSKSSYLYLLYHALLDCRLVGMQYFPPLRNRPVSMTFSKVKSLLFFMIGVNRGFCAGFQDERPNSLFNRRKTGLMSTSVSLECEIARTFLQKLIGERTTTRCLVWSSLTEVLRGRLLRFRSQKIPSVRCLAIALCADVFEHFKFPEIFLPL